MKAKPTRRGKLSPRLPTCFLPGTTARALAEAAGLNLHRGWSAWQLGCLAVEVGRIDESLTYFGQAVAMLADPLIEQVYKQVQTLAQLENEAQRKRIFHVRLTVDEQGQVRRTFVEHAHSGKKETFVDLDIQRLASFMKACIRPRIIPAAAVPPYPTTLLSQTPIPTSSMSATHLVVSDVQVFRQEAPGVLVLNIIPGESVTVQSLFQLRGPQASHLTDEGSPYEVLVYANEVTSGVSSLLTSCQANLAKGVLEYVAQMQAPSLSPGLYRLFTMVVLLTPLKAAGYYEGPIIKVAARQPSASFASRMQEPVSQRDQSPDIA